jgi:APA family basic amino acid/polyamine antiporter
MTWIKPRTAIAIVVANMIGTGVFTSLGYQLVDLDSPLIVLLLWVLGGVTALCGALTYAELTVRLPRSGGEYNYMREIYHPSLGFVSGWISIFVGFSAPTALAAMTFAAYLTAALDLDISRTVLASVLVIALTAFHCRSVESSSGVQDVFTFLKLLLILVFCVVVGIMQDNESPKSFIPESGDFSLILTAGFAVSLIYVNYAYTGWNVATYIAGELENPRRDIPRVLVTGTLMVMVMYILLNGVFLLAAPMDEMRGKIEIGVVVAEYTFGETGAMVMGAVLSLLLVSTVSAMILAGPRVIQVMGEDYALFKFFSKREASGVPLRAILTQSFITILFVVSATFESVLVFAGFVMGLNSMLTVMGLFVLRWRSPELPEDGKGFYQTPLYPLPPLIFCGLMTWTLVFLALNRVEEVAYAAGLIAAGFVAYWFVSRRGPNESDCHGSSNVQHQEGVEG